MSEFCEERIPLAYPITFHAYGTWLHGDRRGSVDRFHNRFGATLIPHNERWRKYNRSKLTDRPVKLGPRQIVLVEEAVRETCNIRNCGFWTTNVRSNHVHTVVSALCKPDKVLGALKANATRKLREAGCWRSTKSPWVDRGSKRYLWTGSDVIKAVVYVEYDQGEPLDCRRDLSRCWHVYGESEILPGFCVANVEPGRYGFRFRIFRHTLKLILHPIVSGLLLIMKRATHNNAVDNARAKHLF